jgi:mRNA interferase RelE/StbE
MKTPVTVRFSRDARKFLAKHPSLITQECTEIIVTAAVHKLTREEELNIDVKRLQGVLHQFFRIRTGDIRIIFSVEYDVVHIASVSQIDVRGNVY